MTPYENLANAIILRAVEDWRDADRRLRRKPQNRESRALKEETEEFFLSDWFSVLSKLDGETLLRRLQEEAENK